MNPAQRGVLLGLAVILGLGRAAGAQAPALVEYVLPTYPQIAHSARVEGVVELDATVDSAGKVTDVRFNRSIPLLNQAAIDAVSQWQFAPRSQMPANVIVTVRFTLNDPFRYPRPATYRQPLPSWIPGNFAFVYEYRCPRTKVEIDSIGRAVTNSHGDPPTVRRFVINFDLEQASDVYVALVGAGFYDPSIGAHGSVAGGRRTWKEVAPAETGIQQTGDRIIVTVVETAPVIDVQNARQIIKSVRRKRPQPREFLHTLSVRRDDSWTVFSWEEPLDAHSPKHGSALAEAGKQIRALVKRNLTDTQMRPNCL